MKPMYPALPGSTGAVDLGMRGAQFLGCLAPLRDIAKHDYGADQYAMIADRRGGIVDPEGRTVPAPEQLVLDLMHRVSLIPTVRRALFGPRITVFTKGGRSFTKEGTGREFIWDFEEEARRIRPIAPGLAIGEAQFAELIDACRQLDLIDAAADKLISLTIPA